MSKIIDRLEKALCIGMFAFILIGTIRVSLSEVAITGTDSLGNATWYIK